MTKIGVIADTHIPRRREIPRKVLEEFQGVDLIVHAGDIQEERVLKELAKLAPVEAVAGNNDPVSLKEALGYKKILTLGGFQIGIVHGDKGPGRNTPERALRSFENERPDCIVFGHSHLPYNQWKAGTLLFNPGSPTDPRRQPLPSFGIIKLSEQIIGNIVLIDQ